MRYRVEGADAATGSDRQITVDAADETTALSEARSQGIFVSKVHRLPDGPIPDVPSESKIPHENPSSHVYRPTRQSRTADLLQAIGMLQCIVAIIAGFAIGDGDATFGFIVAVSGIVAGLLLVAAGEALDYLYEAVQRLREIEVHLDNTWDESKGE